MPRDGAIIFEGLIDAKKNLQARETTVLLIR